MILIKKGEKLTTNFEPTDDSDVINKSYPDAKLSKNNGHSSFLEKDYNGFKLQYNKQSVENFFIQRAVITTIQVLYDKRLLDSFHNANNVLENFLFITRRRPNFEKVNDDIQ